MSSRTISPFEAPATAMMLSVDMTRSATMTVGRRLGSGWCTACATSSGLPWTRSFTPIQAIRMPPTA